MSYEIGRVYRIICLPEPNIQYVGSTFDTLRSRWQNHKRGNRAKVKNTTSISKYFDKYGIENFKIILIKEYPVVDKLHLQSKEQLWISKINCVNQINPFRIKYVSKLSKEYKQMKAKSDKNYRDTHKEKLKIKYKEKYVPHPKIKLTEEQLKENRRLSQLKIKEQQFTRIECPCGGSYLHKHKQTHFRTKKHIAYLEL